MEKRQREFKKQPKASHRIEFRATAENVDCITAKSLENMRFDICCTQCGKVYKEQTIEKMKQRVEGTDEWINYQQTCSDCNRIFKIEIIDDYTSYKNKDFLDWQPILNIDCRGCRINASWCAEWTIISKSETEFKWDSQDDFYAFDDTIFVLMGISELDFHVRALRD